MKAQDIAPQKFAGVEREDVLASFPLSPTFRHFGLVTWLPTVVVFLAICMLQEPTSILIIFMGFHTIFCFAHYRHSQEPGVLITSRGFWLNTLRKKTFFGFERFTNFRANHNSSLDYMDLKADVVKRQKFTYITREQKGSVMNAIIQASQCYEDARRVVRQSSMKKH